MNYFDCKPVLLRDNRKLSNVEKKLGREIIDTVHVFTQKRPEYIQAHEDIHPDFGWPSGNWQWEGNDFILVYNDIVNGFELDLLRHRSQNFSGYSLTAMASSEGLSSLSEIPGDDALSERVQNNNMNPVVHWHQMMEAFPFVPRWNPPRMFGEIGHDVGGVLVNSDTVTYQERINLLYASGVLGWLEQRLACKGDLKILEIGAGYGALAHALKSLFPAASYTVLDIPESLVFSSLYLSLSRPDCPRSFTLSSAPFGWQFVPNYMADHLDDPFDLVINTLSLAEMTVFQIKHYAFLIKEKWLKDDGLFFEQNQKNPRFKDRLGQGGLEGILGEFFDYRYSLGSRASIFVPGTPKSAKECHDLLEKADILEPIYFLAPQGPVLLNGQGNIWAAQDPNLRPPQELQDHSSHSLLTKVRKLARESDAIKINRFISSYGQYNLIQYGEWFYGVPQSIGAVDLNRKKDRDLKDILKSLNLDDLKSQIDTK